MTNPPPRRPAQQHQIYRANGEPGVSRKIEARYGILEGCVFHGTSTVFVEQFRTGMMLLAEAAAAAKTDGQAGFYLATVRSDAEFFAVRLGQGASGDVIVFDIEEDALTSLLEGGATLGAFANTGRPPFFEGDELFVPVTAFELFNYLAGQGRIHVSA